MKHRNGLVWLVLALAVTLAAPSAWAQDKGARRAKVEERIQKLRGKVLRSDVGLDDAKAKQVEKILDQHKPERQKLQKQMREHRQAVRALLQADSNDQAAYSKRIRGIRSTEKQIASLRDKEFDALAKLMTPKQQAKLVVSLRKMQGKIRSGMRRRGRD